MISYKKLFKIFVSFLFLSYLVLYFAQLNGYYENLNNEKKVLTEEKIKEFEKDVKNGKRINIDDYMIYEKKDYSNRISDFGLFTSKTFGKYFTKGLTDLFSLIDKMVNN